MINVPEKFRPHIHVDYPENNKLIFEEWFYESFSYDMIHGPVEYYETYKGKYYLPIFWTSYFVNHCYGNDARAKQELQSFVNSLDRSKKYFSIIQYDSGPLIKLPDNIKMFAMSGNKIDYPLPLICQPHPYKFDNQKDIFCSFIGRVTHPIRKKMINVLRGNENFFISTNIQSTEQYCKTMSRSTFALCPRGFGQTSFRICEALQYGSIPVYISDDFIQPHNIDFNSYGVMIHAREIEKIDSILSKIKNNKIIELQENGRKIYNDFYSFEGCKKVILDNI